VTLSGAASGHGQASSGICVYPRASAVYISPVSERILSVIRGPLWHTMYLLQDPDPDCSAAEVDTGWVRKYHYMFGFRVRLLLGDASVACRT
jgi:hypothetical protein